MIFICFTENPKYCYFYIYPINIFLNVNVIIIMLISIQFGILVIRYYYFCELYLYWNNHQTLHILTAPTLSVYVFFVVNAFVQERFSLKVLMRIRWIQRGSIRMIKTWIKMIIRLWLENVFFWCYRNDDRIGCQICHLWEWFKSQNQKINIHKIDYFIIIHHSSDIHVQTFFPLHFLCILSMLL